MIISNLKTAFTWWKLIINTLKNQIIKRIWNIEQFENGFDNYTLTWLCWNSCFDSIGKRLLFHFSPCNTHSNNNTRANICLSFALVYALQVSLLFDLSQVSRIFIRLILYIFFIQFLKLVSIENRSGIYRDQSYQIK